MKPAYVFCPVMLAAILMGCGQKGPLFLPAPVTTPGDAGSVSSRGKTVEPSRTQPSRPAKSGARAVLVPSEDDLQLSNPSLRPVPPPLTPTGDAD